MHSQGTSTSDGIGLLVATVNQFVLRQDECPFVLVTTHFHDIFRHSLFEPSSLLRFEVLDEWGVGFDFLYMRPTMLILSFFNGNNEHIYPILLHFLFQ